MSKDQYTEGGEGYTQEPENPAQVPEQPAQGPADSAQESVDSAREAEGSPQEPEPEDPNPEAEQPAQEPEQSAQELNPNPNLFSRIMKKKSLIAGLILACLVCAGAAYLCSRGKGPGPAGSDSSGTASQTASTGQGMSADQGDTAREKGTAKDSGTAQEIETSKEQAMSKEQAAATDEGSTKEQAAAMDEGSTKEKADTAETGATSQEEAAAETKTQADSIDLTLGFAGDICLADNYIPMQHLQEIGSEDIADGIDPRYIRIMRDMDLMWINNEFVYSRRGEPLPTKAWTFCGDPDNVKYLKDLGVDIVGLANNHTFDYGEESFMDTLKTLEDAKIPYVGAGRTLDQAKAPVYLESNGVRIAYVAASRAEYTIYTPEATDTEPGILWCYDNTRFLESIREAAENADYVIALPHWGVEHSTELEEAQTEGAHAYIDAGADAVIGAHPHILQGIEYYKGKPILYSLGNFWFDGYDIDTLVARLHIKGKKADIDSLSDNAGIELRLYPGTQSGAYTGLADTDEWKSRILDYLESISVNVTIDKDGVVHPASP